ncbi:MAG TPA: hypothetical protein VHE83_13420 [Mycobacteriales bacterium]|nr:hypothetical protein [Mycobacteriales bacterium]
MALSSADWATVASLATAAGTLVLALATFASVRSGNRAARVAEASLLVNLRPVLTPTRPGDPAQRIRFMDDHWVTAEGAEAAVEVTGTAIYLAFGLRNVGNGLGVLDRWKLLIPDEGANPPDHADPSHFRRLTRDLIVAPGDIGFWQGALRDDDPWRAVVLDAIKARRILLVELLYGDHEGGQRTITRFALIPDGGDAWTATVSRHWNLDRSDPR